MVRLPQPGGDDGQWGNILNDFLSQVHKTDGTLKDNSVTGAAIAPGVITTGAIKDATISETKLDAALQAKVNGIAGGSSGLTLSGDVSGPNTATVVDKVKGVAVSGTPSTGQVLTATSNAAASWQTPPTGVTSVAGRSGAVTLTEGDIANLTTDLAAKAADNTVVHLANAETVSGVKTFSASPIVPTPTTNTQAANKSYVDTAVAGAGGGSVSAATAATLGTVKLTGDLGGTDGNTPTVTGINGVAVSGTPTTGQVLKATSASTASWQADAVAGSSSGFNYTPTSITADYTAGVNEAIFADATANAITITLPAPALNATVWVMAMDNSVNSIQVVAPSGKYINGVGVGSITINVQYNSAVFWSDGNNWYRW